MRPSIGVTYQEADYREAGPAYGKRIEKGRLSLD